MDDTTLLFNITLMLVIAGVCSIVLKRLKFPSIIGYIFAGFLLSPFIFTEVVIDESLVSIFASIGIVMLMFFIGLELNLGGLRKVASYAATIVIIEMSLMVIIGYALGTMLGYDVGRSLFLGVVISCASTAVVLGVMRDNKNIDHKLARAVTGILVLEDIGLIIILAIASPIMGTGSDNSIASTIGIIAVFIGLTMVVGLTIVPRLMEWVSRHYSGEILFLIGTGIAFGLALVSNVLGLSEAIGAFLAGILISQADCCQTVIRKVEPMKEMFMAIFFISIGLQLDPDLVFDGLGLAVLIAAVFIVGKILSLGIGCMVANFKTRSSFAVATSMVAMGEFSFVVAKEALDSDVIDGGLYASIIGAAVITMVLLPFISKNSSKIFDTVVKHLPKRAFETMDRIETSRLEARKKMARSNSAKRLIRRQLMYLMIDTAVILIVLLSVNFLDAIYDEVSVLLFVVASVIIIPAVVHMTKRVRVISEVFASMIEEDREKVRRAHAYKFFKNFISMAMFILLLGLILPSLPGLDGLPMSPIGIFLGIVVVVWLTWDTLNARYDKITTMLSRSLTESEAKDDDGPSDNS